MTTITDEFMQQMLSKTKQYCIVILEAGPNRYEEGMEKIIWEHGWKKSFGSRKKKFCTSRGLRVIYCVCGLR